MDARPDPALAALAASRAARTSANGAYMIVEPLRRIGPVIFASPHSGRHYPADLLLQSRVSLISLRRSEDLYVDELFSAAASHGAPLICALQARAYVDVNRDPAELDPEMFAGAIEHAQPSPRVQAGLGAIPRIAGDGQSIYRRKLPAEDAARRMREIHAPYHEALTGLLDEARDQFGCAIVIDCHSMPSSARGPQAPDVVLGDRYGAACHPSITTLAEATLRRLGYRTVRNSPFAGGYTTQNYGRPADNVHALQIELSRGLYVDERTLDRTQGFRRVRADMARLAEALVAAEFHRSLG